MHDQLETYLKQIELQLKALPAEKQQEELREVEQHLQSMVAGYIELGDTEEEAVASAIRQFGNPKKVGRALRKACKNRGESLPHLFAAGLCTFFCHAILVYFQMTCLAAVCNLLFNPHHWLYHQFPRYPILFEILVFAWGCVPAPFIAGRIGSALAPGKAVVGIIAIYAELALCVLFFDLGWRASLALLVMTTFACLGALSCGEAGRVLGDRIRALREPRERQLSKE